MKGLKSVRFVYKQHLLPPLVLPFLKNNSFLNMNRPTEAGTKKTKAYKQEKVRLQETNKTIVEQIVKFKEHYIVPLRECPFYYDLLDAAVKRKLLAYPNTHGNYLQTIKKMSAQERLKVYSHFQKKYKDFKTQLQGSNLTFFEEVKYLPIFVFESTHDLLVDNKKSWSQLSELEQINWQERYQRRLKKHWAQLTAISNESLLSMPQLLALQRSQIEPEVPEGLKALLFN